ncbi:endonuclease/exonuclease/phosphatase family protein [Cognatishimia activa]|uniref:endonuclease/exonuclease/phosphatase family protein n=1 Tax=Cognatishimia activa TaxID=1715691 RepID=UPI001FE01B32|nr:endonuclease/exonuclease/phosphatase family protein [Cognatishimia activa]
MLPSWLGHARYCDDPDRHDDRRKPQARLRRCAGFAAGLILSATVTVADPIRIAIFNTELKQRGPGLLLRDIQRLTPQVRAVVELIKSYDADILVLQSIDYDYKNQAAKVLAQLISDPTTPYAYIYAPFPNSGIPSGLDIDGDGRNDGPRDAQGYGRFPGQGGIAVFSRFEIDSQNVRDFGTLLWRDVSASKSLEQLLPKDAIPIQRLASVGAAAVPIRIDGRTLWILTHHATPPLFDGPEDRNGYRNAAENQFWQFYLDEVFGDVPSDPFILAAQLNVDPSRGQGQKASLNSFLRDDRWSDPFSELAAENRHTAIFKTAGKLRLSYLLPSTGLQILDFGTSKTIPQNDDVRHSRHRLLWIDVDF